MTFSIKTARLMPGGVDKSGAIKRCKDAESLINEGRYRLAENVARHAFTLAQCHVGIDHLAVADVAEHLGLLNISYPETLDVAAEFFRKSLDIRDRQLSPDESGIVSSLHYLGFCRLMQGAYVESVDLLRRACSILKQKIGADKEFTLYVRLKLVNSLICAGLFPDAATELSSMESVIKAPQGRWFSTQKKAHPLADDFEEAKQFLEEERRGCCK